MTRRLISTGSPFETRNGYSRAVVDGDWCFVAGTTGYDYATMEMPADVAEQTRNCLRTIAETLAKADFSLSDVVRVNYIVTDRVYFDALFSVAGPAFSEIRPASTAMVAGLVDPAMKVEIEVTARRRTGAPAN